MSRAARCTRKSLDFGFVLLIGLLVAVICLGHDASQAPSSIDAARPTLTIASANPLLVVGRSFKAGERVTVSVGPRRKTTTAGPRGGFVVRFGRVRCTSATILATGSKGSRAAVSVPKTLCFQP
jgi:hypothetical protein